MITSNKIYTASTYVILGIGSLIILLPMYVLIVTSMKTQAESAKSFFTLPGSINLENFIYVIKTDYFFRNFYNSVIITTGTVIGILIVDPLVAYAIGKNMNTHRGYRFLYFYFTIGLFIPFQVVMIPLIKLMSKFNMMSIGGIIVLYITFSLMQGVFLIVGYYKSIPQTLEEAAIIDGASIFQTYSHIVFPLLKPMVITVIIIRGLFSWNDFFLPLLMLNNSREKWTLPLFQYNFKGEYLFDYSIAFASFLLALLPIMMLYLILQKQFISGLTSGAVKE